MQVPHGLLDSNREISHTKVHLVQLFILPYIYICYLSSPVNQHAKL